MLINITKQYPLYLSPENIFKQRIMDIDVLRNTHMKGKVFLTVLFIYVFFRTHFTYKNDTDAFQPA